MDRSADIAIIGGGIAGLAHAYMALKKGYKVVLFERDHFAVGASVRNFGLLWPVGQEHGINLDRALRSRAHWAALANEAGFWLNENGSLHLAYHEDELAVLEQFVHAHAGRGYKVSMLNKESVCDHSPIVNTKNLLGGMYSATEATVYSRDVIRKLPEYLSDKYGLIRQYGVLVKEIALPLIVTSEDKWKVNKAIVCNGADFQTLYPETFLSNQIAKCKLQMMRGTTSKNVSMGPSLCAGLTLLHYPAFKSSEYLDRVRARFDAEAKFERDFGIHVLLAQNAYGDFTIGDSHEYGQTLEPFDSRQINDAILKYLRTFVDLPDLEIIEYWNGIYPKFYSGNELIVSPETDVYIINGLGGAGMTLSFGIAEDVIDNL